jgi:ribosomal protein S18 acetylase RimI-like enzyme
MQKRRTDVLKFRETLIPGDEKEIYKIVSSTGFFNNEEIAIAVEIAIETLQKGNEAGYGFILAGNPGLLTGYCCYGRIPCTKSSFDLYWIAVHSAYQNMGIGASLLEKAEVTVKKAGGTRIYIETSSREIYEPTRRFYSRSDYKEVAHLKDFYDTGDDKIIYLKIL